MKHSLSDLAIFGGPRAFDALLPAGQTNLPEWAKVQEMFSGIFKRHYFSNHGILAQELEEKLCEYLNVRNAVTITNGTIALMHTAVALGLNGKVIVPALTHPATAQALSWAGLTPLFCDVDPHTLLITPELVEPIVRKHEASAVLAVHLWGGVCDVDGFEALSSKHSIPIFYDAAHVFGCNPHGTMVGAAGAAEIFSFGADNILNAAEGGLACTNDDELAAVLRNLRSSYGRRKNVPIPVNANGRFSEFQAGLALLSFNDLEKNRIENRGRLNQYIDGLSDVDGIEVRAPDGREKHNCQDVVIIIDEASFGLPRDMLFKILVSENVSLKNHFSVGVHRRPPYSNDPDERSMMPVTDMVAGSVIMLPSGQVVTEKCVEKVCSIIMYAHNNAEEIRRLCK